MKLIKLILILVFVLSLAALLLENLPFQQMTTGPNPGEEPTKATQASAPSSWMERIKSSFARLTGSSEGEQDTKSIVDSHPPGTVFEWKNPSGRTFFGPNPPKKARDIKVVPQLPRVGPGSENPDAIIQSDYLQKKGKEHPLDE